MSTKTSATLRNYYQKLSEKVVLPVLFLIVLLVKQHDTCSLREVSSLCVDTKSQVVHV